MSYTDYTNYSLDPVGRSRFFGIYSGTVINSSDPSSANRLQISVPQITGDDFLNWAEPSLTGDIVLPTVGDKVWVTFESGDTSYPVWMSGSNSVADAVYGAFSSYVTQVPSSTLSNPVAMAFEKIDENYQVSVVANDRSPSKKTRITFAVAGTYNIQFSAQFQNLSDQDQDVYIWLRENWTAAKYGTNYSAGNVEGSTGLVSVPSTHGGTPGHTIAGRNFVLTVAAGDFYEFMWQAPVNASVTIKTFTDTQNSTTGAASKPSTASLVLTVTPVISAVAGSGSGGGSGSITSITAASPLTGGTITSSGTIGLNQTAIGITTSQVVGLDTALAGKASTSHASTHGVAGYDSVSLDASQITAGTLEVARGGTGVTTSTGTGAVVRNGSPSFTANIAVNTSLGASGIAIYASSGVYGAIFASTLSASTANHTLPTFTGTLVGTGDYGTPTQSGAVSSLVRTTATGGIVASGTVSGNVVSATTSVTAPTLSCSTGGTTFAGATSGTSVLKAPAVAGSNTALTLPSTAGTLIGTGDTGTVSNTMLATVGVSKGGTGLTSLPMSAVLIGNGTNTAETVQVAQADDASTVVMRDVSKVIKVSNVVQTGLSQPAGTSGSEVPIGSAFVQVTGNPTHELTLPAGVTGKTIWVRNAGNGAVTSAASNIIPKTGGSATTAILPATTGAWAMLVYTGTNWQIFASGT